MANFFKILFGRATSEKHEQNVNKPTSEKNEPNQIADKTSKKGSLLFSGANRLVYLGRTSIDIDSISYCEHVNRDSYAGTMTSYHNVLYAEDGRIKKSKYEKSWGPSGDDYSDYMETSDGDFLSFQLKDGTNKSYNWRDLNNLEFDKEVWDWLVEIFSSKTAQR